MFDLDVNADGDLLDAVDGAAGYLPGYEGAVAKVSRGSSFNVPNYQGQQMKLVLDGIGKTNADVTKVEFVIDQVSSWDGYASNRTDPSLEGETSKEDYSFRRNGNEPTRTIAITPTSIESTANGGAYGGAMDDTKTWVNFYCKDFGGASRLQARIYRGLAVETLLLSVPVDNDSDGLADKWEIEMGKRWSAQYGLPPMTDTAAKAMFNRIPTNTDPAVDNELADPDGVGGPLSPQAEAGDAHTVMEEYRGYILDGGGLDGNGVNGHAGGHIRLDPARKEILVEVDRAAVLNNVPGNDLKPILNGASGVFSQATRGAGIYMYWLMDEAALDLPKDKLDTDEKRVAAWKASRDTVAARAAAIPNLATDFIHLLVVGENGMGAVTWDKGNELAERGTMLAVSDMKTAQVAPLDPARFDERLMTATAHEITHMLSDKTDFGAFDGGEHTSDANGIGGPDDAEDQTDIMYYGRVRGRMEIATIKFFPVVQAELKVRSKRALEAVP